MGIDVERAQFENADVLRVVAGLTAATVQTWVNRGLLDLSQPNPGTGQRRLYTALDVCGFALMKDLSDLGFPPMSAAKVVRKAIDHERETFKRSKGPSGPAARMVIYKNPEGSRTQLDSGEIVPADPLQVRFIVKEKTPDIPHTCVYLAFGEVVLQTLQKLEAIARD